MQRNRTLDMTHGDPTRLILTFAIPMLISTLFQQLYGMVDTVIVGRGVGVSALAAVGATGSLHFFVLGFVSGLTYGFGVLFAQKFGAGDLVGLRRMYAAAIELSVMVGLVITLAACFGSRALLTMLNTPANILEDAWLYITIIYAALPITLGYNLLSAALRSVGDSKTPLIAMLASSALNIGLDLLFVFSFHMGILGVALATVIAQGLSCVICLIGLRQCGLYAVSREDFRECRHLLWPLLKLGLPVACMNSVTAVGSMLLQRVVNRFGDLYVAGYTAAQKLVALWEQPGNTLGAALSVFVGQNLGAKRLDRVRGGVRKVIGMSLLLNAVLGAVLYFGRDLLMGLFVQAEEATAVLPVSGELLTFMSAFLGVLGMLFVYRFSLQGMGDTIVPMLSGFLELALRMGLVLWLEHALGFTAVCIAEVGAWTGAAVLLGIGYYARCARLSRSPIYNSMVS